MSSVRWPTGGANWQTQQLSHTERRDMKGKSGGKSHSWWWDSHNAPKNSKWLEDNLNDMDAKVKAMLKLIEEDADSFAKRAEMYYKKRPELVSLVEEFYRAYRSLAERYDQLTGHIRQIPQEIQAQFGFTGDAPPGSPGSGGSVRRRAAGFSAFAGSLGFHKHSKEKGRKDGTDSSSSSSSDSESDSKHSKPKQSDEMLRLQQDNEQLREDLEKGAAHHQALESRLAELQEELKSLQHENVQLHRNAASAHSEIAALEAEIERLKRENHTLGEEASSAARAAERLQQELNTSQGEKHHISIKLEEAGLAIRDLEGKIIELEARIVQLSEELVSSMALSERQEQELTALQEERSTLQNEVSVQATRILELEEEIARLKGSLSLAEGERDRTVELHQSLEKTLSDVHIELSSLKEDRGKLSEELLLRVQHVQSLEQKLHEVQEIVEGLEIEKVDMIGLLSKAESSLVDQRKEFDSMQGRLNEEISVQVDKKLVYQKQVEDLQAALEAFHSERTRGVELQDLFQKRSTDLEHQLKQAQEALEFSEKEKTELTCKAETSLSELRCEFDSMQERLNAEISVQASRIVELEEEIAGLKRFLSLAESERDRNLELQENLQKTLADVQIDLLSLQEEKLKLSEDLLLRVQHVQSLEQRFNDAQEAIEGLVREKADVIGQLSRAEGSLVDLQNELDSMQVRLNEEISVQVNETLVYQKEVEELQAALKGLHNERTRGVELQDLFEKRVTDLELQLKQAQNAFEYSQNEKTELVNKAETSLSELRSAFELMQGRLNGEISVQSQEKLVLVDQLEELKATLEALHGERSRGVELQDFLEKRLRDFELQLKQTKEALKSTEIEKIEVSGLLTNVEIDLSDLQAEFAAAQERLNGEISVLANEKQTLQSRVEELEAALAALHGEKSRGLEVKDVLEKRLMDLEQHLEQVKAALELSEREKAEVAELLSKVEVNLQELQEESSSMQARLSDEISALSQEKQVLTAQLEELQATLAALHGEKSRGVELQDILEKQLIELRQELSQAKHEASSLSDELADRAAVILQLEEAVNSRDGTVSRLQGDLLAKEEERDALRSQLEDSIIELQSLKEELQKLRLLLEDSEELAKSLETQANSLKDDLEVRVALIGRLEGEVQEREVLILSLREELSVKLEEGHALREQVEALMGEKVSLMEENSLSVTEIERLKRELEEALEKLSEKASIELELATLTEAKCKLELECDSTREHVQQLEIKEASLESQIWKLKSEIQDLDDRHKELAKILQEKTNDCEALEAEKQGLLEALLATQHERDSAVTKCDSLEYELAQENEARVEADAANSKYRAEIAELLAEIARLQKELLELKDENKVLVSKLDAALEQERIDEMEIDTLLKAVQGSHEENGSSDIVERSWHFEPKHSGEGKHSTFRHLKESMLNLLTDRSRIRQEAAAHAEQVKALNLEIENSGQILETSRGDYRSLVGKYETTLAELQGLHLRIAQFEEQVHVLEEENKKLQDQFVAAVRDSDQLSSELLREKKELYEKLVIEGEHVLKLQQELKLVREETVENRRTIDELQKRIDELLLEIKEISDAKDDQENSFREEIQLYTEEKASLTQSLNEALESVSLEQAEVLRLQKEITSKDQLLRKLEEEIELLKVNLAEKQQELSVLHQQRDSLEDRLEAHSAHIHKLEESSILWQEEKSSLTASLSLNEQKSMDLLVQLGVLTQEKEDIFNELQVKVVSLDEQEQEVQKVHKQLEESELKLQNLQRHSASILEKYETTLAELESLRLRLSSLQEENDRLEHDVLARTVSVAELTETVSSVEKQNAELGIELKSVQETEHLLQEQITNLQIENEQLSETVKSGSERIQMLDEEIFNLREMHVKLQSEHECVSNEKQRSLDEHSLTLLSLEKVKKTLHFHQSENERRETELRSQSARIQELEVTMSNLEKEKHAFSVEIASTVLLVNDVQRRADGLQDEINQLRRELISSNEQLQEKTEKVQELLSMLSGLQQEKAALSTDLEMKIQAFGSLDASFCALKDEHLVFVDKYEVLTEESATGAKLILELQEEISRLRSEKGAQDQVLVHREADIQRFQEDLSLVQDSEKQLRELLDVKVQAIAQREEELDKLKAARLAFQEEHERNTERLEIELKRLELVVIGLRDEKIALSEQHALTLGRSNDLEAMCKSLQKQLAEQIAERNRLEAQLSLVDELRKEALDDEEMVRVMQERVASKQLQINQMQSINEGLKEITRKFESEVENLKDQIISLQKKNTLLAEEVSTKASLVQEVNQSFTSFKEQKVVFEGGLALAVGNFTLVQAEVDKLLQKISKLNELSITTGEDLQKMEERICKLQVSNLNLRDEASAFAKKEKSYVIAVRFMRAEFFCLVQRVKAMKEERLKLEQGMETERKRSGESLSGLQQELAFLREENKRQRTIIFDRAEEKREAIRQLCATLDYMQNKNKRLEAAISSVRDKIQRRIAASSTRRS